MNPFSLLSLNKDAAGQCSGVLVPRFERPNHAPSATPLTLLLCVVRMNPENATPRAFHANDCIPRAPPSRAIDPGGLGRTQSHTCLPATPIRLKTKGLSFFRENNT
jgi:hypothetical protein